jgi:hypothetical protein
MNCEKLLKIQFLDLVVLTSLVCFVSGVLTLSENPCNVLPPPGTGEVKKRKEK